VALKKIKKGATNMNNRCQQKTEVFSRVVGFYRPVQQWNKGKKEEFENRKEFYVKPKVSLI
jgi:ribonucleoside-triphosphate reductase